MPEIELGIHEQREAEMARDELAEALAERNYEVRGVGGRGQAGECPRSAIKREVSAGHDWKCAPFLEWFTSTTPSSAM